MLHHHTDHEALILNLLRTSESLTIEQVAASLPELSWSQVFHAVDALSRRGEITLERRGFSYNLRCRLELTSGLRNS
jgi:hypothetical protein